jgi:hypothetical protein
MKTKQTSWRDAIKNSKFAKPAGDNRTWEGFGNNAQHERVVMVREFHTWIVERRHEIELKVIHSKQWSKETAPFARAGMDAAETPADVPLCVFEFAQYAMEYLNYQRKLDLLNVYYNLAATDYDESGLQVHQGFESEVAELWAWFMEERAEAELEEWQTKQEKSAA